MAEYLGFGDCTSDVHARHPTRATLDSQTCLYLTPTGVSPSVPCRSRQPRLRLHRQLFVTLTPHPPVLFAQGFGLAYSLFARCYSGNHSCFLFLPVLRCFSSERSQSGIDSRSTWGISPCEEVPLGHPRIKDFMRLPAAYRCLSRPSSASQPSHPPLTV